MIAKILKSVTGLAVPGGLLPWALLLLVASHTGAYLHGKRIAKAAAESVFRAAMNEADRAYMAAVIESQRRALAAKRRLEQSRQQIEGVTNELSETLREHAEDFSNDCFSADQLRMLNNAIDRINAADADTVRD